MEKAKSIEFLTAEIARLEKAIFVEEMADFMDWGLYRRLKADLRSAKAKLAELI